MRSHPRFDTLESRITLSSGLVAAYGFNEGSGAVLLDLSGNGNHGSIANATWSSNGKYGGALSFNGTNALVTIPDAPSLRLSSGMTLEAWVRPSKVSSAWRDVIHKGDDNYYLEATSIYSGRPVAGVRLASTGSRVETVGNATIKANTWNHLAATFDGATLRLYVNGTQVSSKSGSGVLMQSADPLQIGGNPFYGQFFAGLIDEVRIYNRALSQAEIKANLASPVTEQIPPQVIAQSPTPGAKEIPTDASVTATFNEPVQPSTILFSLTDPSGAAVPTVMEYDPVTFTATLTPAAPLSLGATYTASLSGAKDLVGNSMSSMAWSFTIVADVTPPSVTAQSPAPGTAGVSRNAQIQATFSEALQPETLSFTLTDKSGVAVPASVTYDSATSIAKLAPASPLAYFTVYTASLSGGRDLAGNLMVPVSWSFTTETDPTPPPPPPPTGLVAAYSFDEGSGTTAHDASGAGNHGSIGNAAWTSSGKSGGALSFNGTNAVVTIPDSPSLRLTNAMTLMAWVRPTSVTSVWRDVIYKGDDNYYLEATSNQSAKPVVGARLGSSGSHAEAVGSSALAVNTWSHLAATYDGATIRLYVNGSQVASKAASGSITTSSNPLQIGGNNIYGQYFAGLIDDVRVYNVALTASQIQTEMNNPVIDGPDTTPPTVTSRSPASGATGVDVNTQVTATFSEAVQPSTISFVLKDSAGKTVSSSVSYNSTTFVATLTPSSPLAFSTTYTATLSGAKDLAGNTMSTVSWSFTTAAQDTTPPTVTSRSPASGATGVDVNTQVTATFSEAVQPSTISFVLKDSAGKTVSSSVSYNSTTFVATLTPSSPLAFSTTYTATLSGAKDLAGNTMSTVSWSFTTAAQAPSSGTMLFQDYNGGTTVPKNKAGQDYPNIYTGEGSAGTMSINTSDAITGNSLQAQVTKKGLYLQWNPYDGKTRGFAREYVADPAGWQFNTYNRLSFWIKRPTTSSPLITDGSHGTYVGTYVKRVTNADPYSDETGGSHYYHSINLPNNGQWTYVIINMHPDHQRGNPGGVDPGNLPHPTGESQYNYFDALTRFYIDDTIKPTTGTYLIDDIRFYKSSAAENDQQVYSLTGTYHPGTNELIITWNRHKDENNVKHEVRYAFSDIHQLGWEGATAAPGGIITPPGWQGYNGMYYKTTALPLSGQTTLYVAIKPQNSSVFSQIALPLGGGALPMSVPAAPTTSTSATQTWSGLEGLVVREATTTTQTESAEVVEAPADGGVSRIATPISQRKVSHRASRQSPWLSRGMAHRALVRPRRIAMAQAAPERLGPLS